METTKSLKPMKTRNVVAVALASLALVAAGCGRSAAPQTQAPPAQSVDRLAAARSAAVKAADGGRPGGTINLLGVLSGQQLDAYLGTFKPFEEATGTTLRYESTRDLGAVLQTRVAGGNPPDVVSNPSAGQIKQLGAEGKLIPLDSIVDMTAVKADYPAGLVDLVSANGKLYGLFYNTAVQGLVWYNPTTYQGPKTPASWQEISDWTTKTAAGGTTPWCIGLESGPASGWPGAVWVEQFVLQQAGAAAFDRWWQGQLAWTSPEIKAAFQQFGKIASDTKQVSGGPTAVLTTSFNISPQGMFAKPPACYLHVQADFLGNAVAQEVPGVTPVKDIDFFPFPAVNSANAGSIEISGEALALLKDTPQGRAFMRYVATPEFSALVAGTGQWIGANRQTPADAYTTPLGRHAAEVYANAKTVRYAAQTAMPPAMSQAFLASVMAYIKDPSSLDTELAKLDTLRQSAYH
jgi:alpha-glucoside transport system substrate-binding protein